MANALAWLLGRPDPTGQPSPIAYDDGQPSLRAYHPSPSEQFGNWISDLLGAGPGASLPHQAFAKGVPSVLSLFPPLGVGLNAADFAHARAADDPMGAAAAAIGMVPGAGKLGPKLKGAADIIKAKAESLNAVEQAYKGATPLYSADPIDIWHPATDVSKLAPGQKVIAGPGGAVGTFKGVTKGGTTVVDWKNKSTLPDLPFSPSSQDIAKSIAPPVPVKKQLSPEEALAEIAKALDITWGDEAKAAMKSFEIPNVVGKPATITTIPITEFGKTPTGLEPIDPAISWLHPEDTVYKEGQWWQKKGTPATKKASLGSATEQDFADAINASGTHHIDPATGKTVANLPSKEGYTLSSAANPNFPGTEKDYFVHNPSGAKVGELTYDPTLNPAQWQLSMEGVEPKFGTSPEGLMQYIPSWHKQTIVAEAPKAKPAFSFGKGAQTAVEPGKEIYPTLPSHWKPNPEFDNKVTDLISKDFSPVDWKTYTPKSYGTKQTSSAPKLTQVTPEHVQSLGGNTNLSLWKGGNISGYPTELPDVTGKVAPNAGGPAKQKFEKAFFLADNPHVAQQYATGHDAGPSPYVALPQKVAEVDWTDLAKKFGRSTKETKTSGYEPIMMKYIIDSARKSGLDMVIAHNINDLGGPQSQYIVLNTNVLRAPSAKFDPSKLHLRYPLAGLAGVGVYTYGASQDPAAAAEKPHINDVMPSIEAAFGSPGVRLPLRN